MILVNQNSEHLNIDGLMLSESETKMVILVRGEILKDDFLTEELNASFDCESGFSGRPETMESSKCLHVDQYILTLNKSNV